MDCGEEARLLAVSDPDEHGDRIATYRCTGCQDRWDLVMEEDAPSDTGPGAGPEAPLPEGETGPVSS